MWRAFFFAVGVMLIILGFECLVAERFYVSQGRIPNVVSKLLSWASDGAPKQWDGPNAGLAFGGQSRLGGDPNVSQFGGPSRFNDQYAGAGPSYYGGAPSAGLQQNGQQPFRLTGFGSPQQGGPASAGLSKPNKVHVLTPKDWMPWSLLAAGSLVVLYTNSTTSRSGYNAD
jgi:hypothetical protein